MTLSEYLPYVLTEVFCLAYTATMFFRINSSIGSEHEVFELRNMIISYFVMILCDIIVVFFGTGIIQASRLVDLSVNALSIIAVAFGCFFWFRFVEDRLQPPYIKNKVIHKIINIPIILITIADVVSIFTGCLFDFDANGEWVSKPAFVFQIIVDYFYLMIPTIYSIYRAVKTHSRIERQEYITYAVYMLAPLAAGFLEDVIPTVPILALNIFMVIHLLFLTVQDMQIYDDALTGLNNRRRLAKYLYENLQNASTEHPVIVFMIDINSFKFINDNYGHLEGDKVLKTFADALRKIADGYNAFVARYGGDEFCLVMKEAKYSPEEITRALKSIDIKSDSENVNYTISASVGYVVCDEPGCDPDAIIGKADVEQYIRKKEWHALHR